MNLYISDLHFGHKNVILFEHRPFGSLPDSAVEFKSVRR